MNRENKVKMNAFFSVEAALVVPLTVSAILLAVCLFTFQYDRCLMEQDVAAQAVKAATAEARTGEELEEKIRAQTAGLYRNKYVAWDLIMLEVKMEKKIIEAVGKGEFRFPVPGWNLRNGEDIWSARAGYKAHRISPITFIRNCRRITGGI
ncbi:MAG: hypothetical protein NC420_09220 [Eubacterium sp.]|nr:hypothetical protein [Eubacterium sp.]MCM1214510.1 hypothetical protein [Lachnospiraceae bacterium]MCM1303555.1 hypothetical protein [Butyrivibrio sp.]MCM1343279.1 hypothetical protein [Muribaculaceae bacterium]MCM1238389.1 hypothetical protein [Lachnospiraceae bacterium]